MDSEKKNANGVGDHNRASDRYSEARALLRRLAEEQNYTKKPKEEPPTQPVKTEEKPPFLYERRYDGFKDGKIVLPRVDFTYDAPATSEELTENADALLFIPVHRADAPTVLQGTRVGRTVKTEYYPSDEPIGQGVAAEQDAGAYVKESDPAFFFGYSESGARASAAHGKSFGEEIRGDYNDTGYVYPGGESDADAIEDIKYTNEKRVDFDYGLDEALPHTEEYREEIRYQREPREYAADGYVYPGGESDADAIEDIKYTNEKRVDFDYGLDEALPHTEEYREEISYQREPREYAADGYVYPGGESDADTIEDIKYTNEKRVDFDYGLDEALPHAEEYPIEVRYAREAREYADGGYVYPGGESDADALEDIKYTNEKKINFDYGLDYSLEISKDASHDLDYTPPYSLTKEDTFRGVEKYDLSYDATTDLSDSEDNGIDLAYNLPADDSGSDFVFLETTLSEKDRKREEEREYLRYIEQTERRDREIKERKGAMEGGESGAEHFVSLADGVAAAVSKSVAVVERRFAYNLRELEYRRKMKLMTFGTSQDRLAEEIDTLDRHIYKLRKKKSKVTRAERKAALRYYAVLESSTAAYAKCNDPQRLNEIFKELDALLLERDEINQRLTELYNGSTRAKNSRLDDKATKIRTKAARTVYRGQKATYKRLRRLHAPLDVKDKVYRLMNKKTEAYSTLAYSKYMLRKRKPYGAAKKELKKNIRAAKKTLRFINADIRHYVKKAEKHHERHKMDIMQTVYIIIAILVCIGGYFLFKNFDAVLEWLKG